jgi:hypothetical protein
MTYTELAELTDCLNKKLADPRTGIPKAFIIAPSNLKDPFFEKYKTDNEISNFISNEEERVRIFAVSKYIDFEINDIRHEFTPIVTMGLEMQLPQDTGFYNLLLKYLRYDSR